METDILIAGLMALATVAVALGLVLRVALRLGEGPTQKSKVKTPRTAPVLRPTSGW